MLHSKLLQTQIIIEGSFNCSMYMSTLLTMYSGPGTEVLLISVIALLGHFHT